MNGYIGGLTRLANCFLAGAALALLAALPAPARAPGDQASAPLLKLHAGSTYHSKTSIQDPENLARTSTSTETFTGTLSESQLYKKWVELWNMQSFKGSCKYEKAKFPKWTRAGRVRVDMTGKTIGLFYKLERKTARSDSIRGEIEGRDCGGRNLNLFVNTDLKISH